MSQSADRLFRKAAIDKLASPDQLDQLVAITNPASWVALVAVLVLCAGVVAWGFFGHVLTRVTGQGILIATGGQVFDAVTATAGTAIVQDIRPGAVIQRGQVLALLSQPDLVQKIMDAKAHADELEHERDRQITEVQKAASARLANNMARESALRDSIAAALQRQQTYEQMLSGQEQLFKSGITTRERVQQVREQFAAAQQTVADSRTNLSQVEAGELVARSADMRQLADARQRAADARAAEVQLSLQQSAFGKVVSPADGRLLEWKVASGTYIAAGTAVASVESGQRGLQFVLYVPPDEGKRVVPGMQVSIELNGMKKEEWGTLVGHIASISEFPSTTQGMLAVLQNETLVKGFTAKGAPFAARVDLQPAATTPSGYAWSGGGGPPTLLSSGMTGLGQVTVQNQAPVSFVLPFLHKAGL